MAQVGRGKVAAPAAKHRGSIGSSIVASCSLVETEHEDRRSQQAVKHRAWSIYFLEYDANVEAMSESRQDMTGGGERRSEEELQVPWLCRVWSKVP